MLKWIAGGALGLLIIAAIVFIIRTPLPADQRNVVPVGDGTAVRAAKEPRIVALDPGLAQTLRDLGVGRLIVGRHGFDAWTQGAVPVVGDQGSIDYEKLIAVNPTHVYLQWGKREVPERLTTLAAERGWKVANFQLLTLDEVMAAADRLYGEFGSRAERANLAALPSAALAEALKPALTSQERARVGPVLLLHTTAPLAALGPGSYHHDLLVRCGATPALATGKAYMTLDAEDVVKLNPAAIVLIQPRDEGVATARPLSPGALKERLGVLAELDIAAVKNGRVVLIDEPSALLAGSGLTTVGAQLRGILAAWAGQTTPLK
ncbi:hypothetical protein BH11PLA1_BH11PLA1_07470 [soil metagenome]